MALAYWIIGKAAFRSRHLLPRQNYRTVCHSAPATDATRGEKFMLGFNRWHLLKGLAAFLCIAGHRFARVDLFLSRTAVDDFNGRRVSRAVPTSF